MTEEELGLIYCWLEEADLQHNIYDPNDKLEGIMKKLKQQMLSDRY